MKITLRASRALSTALAVALFAVVSAPVVHAESGSDIISVPRLTRGAAGNPMRVRRDSAFARYYFASVARAKAPRNANCPGTSCPQTLDCHLTKGAQGAGCISN